MDRTIRGVRLGIVALLSVLVALVSYRYLLPEPPGASPNVMDNTYARLGVLTAHAGFAATALLIGPFQFVAGIRRRWPSVHRRMGTLYVIACIGGGAAGMVLATGVSTGPVAAAGFAGLAFAWLFTTFRAWRLARTKRFISHEQWMIRSFALTLAAVTLRLYLPIAAVAFPQYPFEQSYVAIAWLCWVPNLILAELLIAARRPRKA